MQGIFIFLSLRNRIKRKSLSFNNLGIFLLPMPNLLTHFLTQIWPSSWPTFDPFLTHFFLRKIDFAMKRLFHVKIFHIISIHWKPIYYRLSPFGGFEPLLSIVIISLIFNENLQLALFALYAVYTLFEPFSQLSVLPLLSLFCSVGWPTPSVSLVLVSYIRYITSLTHKTCILAIH